jgi:excisionase family DNA binding protein
MSKTNCEPTEETLLRSTEVARLLDLSPDDVVGLAKRGEIKAVKEGRFWRFRHGDVMAYKDLLGKEGQVSVP